VATRVRSRVVSSAQVDESKSMLSYAWPLAEGLYEVLCLDFPDVVRFMNSSQVAAHDVEQLRKVARRNTVAEPIDDVDLQESSGAEVHVLYGKSSFIASKIVDIEALVPTYIRGTPYGVIVGIPARNVLILHPVETHAKLFASLNVMSQLCPLLNQNYPGPVSADMYFWKDAKLQRISRIDPDTGNVLVDVSGGLAAALEELDE
jgi:hypothetical protein